MAVNKVVYNTENGAKTLIDLTSDTVTPETLAEGVTAHDASGNVINGKMPFEAIPDYVIEEAESAIAKASAHGNLGRAIRFIAISDTHEDSAESYNSQITISNKHAGQAIKYIAERIGLDFVAHLGDASSCGAWATTYNFDVLCEDIKQIDRFVFSGVQGANTVFIPGNHDMISMDGLSLLNLGAYTLFGSSCSGNKDQVGGYGYFDLEDSKVRVVYLNTSDSPTSAAYLALTQAQKNWLCETLIDVNTKSNADEWKIILLSHAPLDFGGANISTEILIPYVNGGSCNGYTFDNNAAQIISNIHGHVHCYSYGYIEERIRRFTIPNACYVGANHYSSKTEYAKWADTETYNKTANSGKDTAFSLITMDLDNGMCYVDNYGAGIDRAFSTDYNPITVRSHSITNNLTNCTNSNNATTINEGASYSATITAKDGYTLGSVTVTMGGTSVPVTNGIINISNVTGAIVITATAIVKTLRNEITNSLDTDETTVYNGTGYALSTRLGSDGTVRSNVSNCVTSGFIPYDGQNVEIVLPTKTCGSYAYVHLYCKYNNALAADAPFNLPSGTLVDGSRRQISYWVSDWGVSSRIEGSTTVLTIPASIIDQASTNVEIEYLRVSSNIDSGVSISDSTFRVSFVDI